MHRPEECNFFLPPHILGKVLPQEASSIPNQQIISFDLDYNDGKNSLTQLENKINLFSFYKKRGICNHC
ncbi:MAG: hypothetical protein Q8877_02975, partial [Sweet potato little leaf phytoplasma]|nr:hypothetical protein [Sweet potato little leaf phytoplasma]